MTKRIAVLAIAFLLILSAPAFAGGDGEDADATIDVEVSEPGVFPIVDAPITIEGFGRLDAQHGPWDEMTLWQILEEKTNVIVEWETPGRENVNERKNLVLASGDLPDIFIKNVLTDSDLIRYGTDGALAPLEDLIPQWMPDFSAVLAQYPDIRPAITAPDGSIYGLPRVNDFPPNQVWRSPLLNLEWIATLGLEVPTTSDEFLDVLRAFRDGDPNGNGDTTDEIPFTSHTAFMAMNAIGGMFGVSYDLAYTGTPPVTYPIAVKADGSVVIELDTPQYRNALRYYATLFQEGLIDNEIFVHTSADYFAKGAAGRVGFTPLYQPRNFAEFANDYDAIVPPVGPEGHQNWNYLQPRVASAAGLVMTRANQYPEATARWFDWWYSDEGALTLHMLIPEFAVEESGVWSYREEVLEAEVGFERFVGQHTIFPGGGAATFATGRHLAPTMAGTPMLSYIEKTRPFLPQGLRPGLRSPEENRRETEIRSDFDVYVEETVSKFVIGELDVDDDDTWDEWVSTLDRLGMNELEQILFDSMNR